MAGIVLRKRQAEYAIAQYSTEDMEDMFNAKTFEDLAKIALRIVERIQPVGIVSGPITNGGAGSVEKNLKIFKETIERLKRSGINVFDQMPFEEHIQRICQDKTYFKGENHLLEVFYLPLFESGFIKAMYFIPSWESSYGAKWEHGQAMRLGIIAAYL